MPNGQSANGSVSFEPLTPTAYLDRAAAAHGDRVGVVDGHSRWTYTELRERCMRLAGALAPLAHRRPVAVLAPNTHVLLEANFGVPWAGVPLVSINTRLSAGEVAYILQHSNAGVLVHDPMFDDLVGAVFAELSEPPVRIRAGQEYEDLLAGAQSEHRTPSDERSLLSINYTSGTTGRPKGVMYHHRGASLQSLAMVGHTGLSPSSMYLWTLPMFHCNGWCFPWAVTAAAATHICLPKVDPTEIWRLVREEGVTHLSGAPTVLAMIAHAKDATPLPKGRPVRITTGGAPPSPAILRRMAKLGFEVTHLYGLTETYGPAMLCDWRPEWDDLDLDAQSRLKARQGVGNMISCTVRVIAEDGSDVPADGTTTGQIALRGNNLMLGYLHDPEATLNAVPDGWFRTGDLGVVHRDGYIELRDRAKDVIISGGENIASVEVEQAILDHPAVLEAAVIAMPDERWGEVPAAYITLQEGASTTAEEIVEHVRSRLARFKAPKMVSFGELPKTSTGKIQKHLLREKAWAGIARQIQ
ncbi:MULTISPECIES: acyl--CoA ligase family protein [unclassified Rhodococcus (in: high G+C Gram-positive bacteria)]|uniref:acyl--CoA ligase family protein n=1 Tax=unclassified Rhodococcus (in: high G+C Gram-positive bacteria) TaxID=192944 RepID=UPI001639B43A|nr:AMP-binding protein [Rhodococcus sp. 3A]MBC2644289.1 AMP-binding protein [Rhodococcus sp. 3A]MBC2890975.1 AMP-binding protein [Rhodococcus sp. 4CII]MBC2897680.1 AMP-binding protein [Rhodococcus sp. 4CII]